MIEKGRICRVGFLPCLINKKGQPEVLEKDSRGRKVFEYVERITKEAGLNASYQWAGDEIFVFDR